jgi:ribosomal protein L14
MTSQDKYIEEEMTISEFAERFLGINKFVPNENSIEEIDISHMDIEIFGHDLKTGKDSFNKINKFIIKQPVNEHYTDGHLKGTDMHRIIENKKEIHLKDHPEFNLVKTSINVVDFDIENSHNYYANGRLNHNTVSGGKSLAYHCSVRVRLNNTGKLKKGDEVVGNVCKAIVVKNRMGPPQRQANFDIYFDSGIADYGSWIKVLKDQNLIKQGGAYYTYKKDDGSEWKFQSKDFVTVMKTDKVLGEEIYMKICDAVIMKYKDFNSQIIDDAVVEADEETSTSEE